MNTKIKLINSKKTFLVSSENAPRFNLYDWRLDHYGYVRMSRLPCIEAGRFALGVTDSTIIVDHISGNKLDNSNPNLRTGTKQENEFNQKKHSNGGTSKYKGVSWYKRDKNWEARIQINGELLYLGRFKTEIEAALAYDEAAKKYFGAFARLNFPEKGSK